MTALRNTTCASNAQEPTFIDILLDETGSMYSCHDATVAGFNAFVDEQKAIDGLCFLTLSKFDASQIKTPYVNLAINLVPPLSFHPRGGTNLYDVVGRRVTELLNQNRLGRSLVVVITDGEDTSSHQFNAASIRTKVAEAMANGISFLYFGAGPNAKRVGLEMGFPETAITVFETTRMRETMATMSAATTAFRAA